MLLSSVDVLNSQGFELNLPLEDISGGFIVKEIDGLDPVKATLVSSSFANGDGEQYHSAKREARNIVVHLGLVPNHIFTGVKDLRDQLYQFFMPKSKAKLTFNMLQKLNETVEVQSLSPVIEGRIESCETALFAKDPTVDISIMCFDPDFYEPDPVIVSGYSVSDATETEITNVGSIETSTIFTLMPNRAVSEFAIYNRLPDGTIQSINFTYPLEAGDVLTINSTRGSKGARLVRGGIESSVLFGITPESAWLELQPGENNLRVYIAGSAIPYTLEYLNKYGGL